MVLMAGWLAALTGRGTAAPALPASGEEAFASARHEMVVEQLLRRGRDITNLNVLAAMGKVARHEFVPEPLRDQAYADRPLPIGHGQTISQPYVVAFMTERLDLKRTDRVLEIGTGSGYQAAILAELAAEVYSIEIVKELAERASATLKRLGCTNVHVCAGDGYQGWAAAAPFDAIIVTCAPEEIPRPLIEQLKDGGRLVIPVGKAGYQDVVVLRKRGDKIERHAVLPVQFVPMTRGGGPSPRSGLQNSTRTRRSTE